MPAPSSRRPRPPPGTLRDMTVTSPAPGSGPAAPHVPLPPRLQLPAVLLQPGRLHERHLDAVGGAELAGAEPHRAAPSTSGSPSGLQFGPVLFLGAWGGALADRVDKRKLLIATQAAAAVLALVLGVLAVTDVVTVWMIWVLAGPHRAPPWRWASPSQQSFLYEMVGPDDLANAVGLNSVVINSSRIIGPAIGARAHRRRRRGALLLLQRRVVPRRHRRPGCSCAPASCGASKPVAREPGQVRAGLQLRLAHAGAAHPAGHAGRHQHAGLQLLGGAAAADQERVRPRRRLLRRRCPRPWASGRSPAPCSWRAGRAPRAACWSARAFAFGVVTIALALAPGYYAGLALLVLMGGAGVLFISTTNALLQLNAADAMRGRVMALWSIVFLGQHAHRRAHHRPARARPRRALGHRHRRRRRAGHRHRAPCWRCGTAGVVEEGSCEAPVCLPDGPAPGDALGEAVEVGGGAAVAGRRPDAAAPTRRAAPARVLKSAAALPM